AVIARKVPMTAETRVGRADQSHALGENRSLKTVTINTLGIVYVRSLLHAEADPRTVGGPIIEIELAVRVLEAEQLTARQRGGRAGLARDVGSDAESQQMIELAGDV